jgi:hypothetical protein
MTRLVMEASLPRRDGSWPRRGYASAAVFGRKTLPAHLRAPHATFLAQAERVESARKALLGCLPVGRVDPAPVPVGLDLLGDELRAVADELAGWRVPEIESAWHAVAEGTASARAAISDAHHVAATTRELEELLDAVGEVVEPLDAWGDAEREWRRLRR